MFHSLKSQGTLDNSTLTLNKFDILNKNILYITHQVDKCFGMLTELTGLLETERKLQKQVDDFYETSPQTDTDEQ